MTRDIKVHGIKQFSHDRLQIFTYCGKDGYRCDGWSGEYDTPGCDRFRAEPNDNDVSCKSCLRAIAAKLPVDEEPRQRAMHMKTTSHIYGYARVSSADQDLSIQEAALRKAGATIIRAEKKSGATTSGRDELATLIEFARAGDTIIVTRIDRLARSIADLSQIVRTLESKGVHLKATEQPIDTSSAAGKAFLQMLGVFAEFETNLRKERQLEGIAKAKAEGAYKGRKPAIDGDKVKELEAAGKGATEIAKELGIGRASVYRYLKISQDD